MVYGRPWPLVLACPQDGESVVSSHLPLPHQAHCPLYQAEWWYLLSIKYFIIFQANIDILKCLVIASILLSEPRGRRTD